MRWHLAMMRCIVICWMSLTYSHFPTDVSFPWNIILPGVPRTHDRIMWTPLRVQNGIQVQMHPWMLVETTHVTEFEYYTVLRLFTCNKGARIMHLHFCCRPNNISRQRTNSINCDEATFQGSRIRHPTVILLYLPFRQFRENGVWTFELNSWHVLLACVFCFRQFDE